MAGLTLAKVENTCAPQKGQQRLMEGSTSGIGGMQGSPHEANRGDS